MIARVPGVDWSVNRRSSRGVGGGWTGVIAGLLAGVTGRLTVQA